MRTKDGADISQLRPELLQLLPVIDQVYWCWDKTPVITSGNDGTHMQGSLHYQNCAFDLRVKHVGEWPARRSLVQALKTEIEGRFPGWYDILHELVGTENEHVHVEASPILLALIHNGNNGGAA